jgi:nicotinamide-nucleotide amidase
MHATTGNAGPVKEIQMLKWNCFYCLATPNSVIVEEFNFGQPVKK